MSKPIPNVVMRALQTARAELVHKRDEAAAPFEREIAEIDDYIKSHAEARVQETLEKRPLVLRRKLATMTELAGISARSMVNKQALDYCFTVLSAGTRKTSAELFQAITDAGIRLQAEDPAGRLVQLLSGDDRFESDRRLGWATKGEASAGTEASGATTSEQGE